MAQRDDASETINQFVSLTGIAPDQARFFIDSANGDLETALSTYYDTAGTTNLGAPTAVLPKTASSTQSQAPSGPKTLSGQPADGLPAEWKRNSQASKGSSNSKSNKPAGGIRGFSDLNGSSSSNQTSKMRGISTLKDISSSAGASGGGDMSDDDDDEEVDGAPDLYAGGGRSGLNVQDPSQQNSGKAGGIVADILKKAKEAGTGPPPSLASASKKMSFFQGPAQTLGSDEVPSMPVQPPSRTSSTKKQTKAFSGSSAVPGHLGSDLDEDDENDDENDDDDDEEVEKHLTFWKDGFSIENGPLLDYEDPKNKEILDAINRGRVLGSLKPSPQIIRAPLDLLGVKLNQRVTMRVQKRLTENYIPPPKPPAQPFSGSGNRLGSPLPLSLNRSAVDSTSSQALRESLTTGSGIIFEVDNSLPVTSVQVRLGDGTRMITRFNHTHTISDIRRQIAASNPSLADRPYALQTTFPSRDLNDDRQTIKEAGLLGSVVVQRFL
ncbi:hypothetical protein BY996DRAFT_4575830 [Phakopsora pachyrhizi]|nr:hypothetical protein BY996DRAFT_4575830 [Phakopsora pachyrhizi]